MDCGITSALTVRSLHDVEVYVLVSVHITPECIRAERLVRKFLHANFLNGVPCNMYTIAEGGDMQRECYDLAKHTQMVLK